MLVPHGRLPYLQTRPAGSQEGGPSECRASAGLAVWRVIAPHAPTPMAKPCNPLAHACATAVTPGCPPLNAGR